MSDEPKPALEVFFSYAHEDEILRQKLDKHLSALKQQNSIITWADYAIRPGQNWKQEITAHLESADIFLLLISADFLASDYTTSTELKRAMERHANRSAYVIPIIARPADWTGTPFQYLQVLPRNQQPIMSSPNPDEAFAQVAKEIRSVVESFKKASPANSLPTGPLKNIPYERNPLFTGRDPLLQELHDALKASTQSSATIALSGLGGMGKTQTAIEYAYRYQNDYDTLLWLRADSAETLLADFFAAAQLLNLPAQREQDQSLVISAVKRWLQTHPRWLLIFDNADDLAVLENILPMQHQGHILITTQSKQTGRMARRISIEDMEQDQAMLFLLRRAGYIGPDDMAAYASPNDQRLAQEIVNLLASLPLALDQAGAYIDETQCGLDGYLDLFKTRHDYLLQHRGKWVKDHPNSVATTFSVAFKRVQEVNPTAADLLRLCAFLDPDSIPEEMIVESESVLPTSLKVLAKDPIKLNEASRDLLNYSLIRRNPDHTLTLHRLVQLALKNEMDTKTQQRWATRAVQVVSYIYPDSDYTNLQLCLQYLPHAQYCALLIEQLNITSAEAAELLRQAGWYLRIAGQYKQAEPLLRKALDIKEATLASNDPSTAESLGNLAELYRAQGRYEEAEPLYERALAIREEVLGEKHPSTATSLGSLASLYRDQGRYEEAEPLYERALTIREKVLGGEHPETATSLHNLALLYEAQERYEVAESLYKRSLTIYEKVLGAEHPFTATALNNLADLYQAQGRNEEAELLYKRALAICEKVLGSEHPHTIATKSIIEELHQE